MLNFCANLVCKTSIHLLCKPWVNRSGRIAYTKARDYSSSLPARYVPKKLLEGEKSVALASKDGKLEKNKRFEPENLIVDEQEALSSLTPCVGSDEGDIASEFWAEDDDVEEPDELEEKHQSNLMDHSDGKYQTQAFGNKPKAERLAIRLLSRRAFTASEVRKKLLAKKIPLGTIDTVVADFQNRGYINDCLYAEAFSRSRFSSSCWGPKRIKETLFKKGVCKLEAEEAVKLVFQKNESVEKPELVVGMSKVSMDHLLVQASKQWLRNEKVSSDKRKSRLVQWLQYRGFNWSVTGFVLKKLESGYVP